MTKRILRSIPKTTKRGRRPIAASTARKAKRAAPKPALFTEEDRAEIKERVEKRAGTEPIPPRPVSAWDGRSDGSPNADAPLDVLLEAMFDDFQGEHAARTTTFLTKVLRSVADDVELVNLATAGDRDGLDHSPAIARVLCRVENRSRMAGEVARRIERAERRPTAPAAAGGSV